MQAYKALGSLINWMLEGSYASGGGGIPSVARRRGTVEKDLEVTDEQLHADLELLEEDIWRLIDCYVQRLYHRGPSRGYGCNHEWLNMCRKCGVRYVRRSRDDGRVP